jgi:hypothetical protein
MRAFRALESLLDVVFVSCIWFADFIVVSTTLRLFMAERDLSECRSEFEGDTQMEHRGCAGAI